MTLDVGHDAREGLAAAKPLSFEDRLSELVEQRAIQRSRIPLDALAWLVAAPVWTVALARACGLPIGAYSTDVEGFFAALVQQRILIAAPTSPGALQEEFGGSVAHRLSEAAVTDTAARAAAERDAAWTRSAHWRTRSGSTPLSGASTAVHAAQASMWTSAQRCACAPSFWHSAW